MLSASPERTGHVKPDVLADLLAAGAEGQLLFHDIGAIVGFDGFRKLLHVHLISARHLKAKHRHTSEVPGL